MKVVGLHGIGNRFEGRETLASDWLPALNSGLVEAGCQPLPPEDFGTIFYGSVFRPSGGRGSGDPLEDLEWGRDLLWAWCNEAAQLAERNRLDADPNGEDPRIQSPEELRAGRARTPESLQALLRLISKSRFFRALGGDRVLVADLREVRLFLHDPDVKQEVLRRCEERLSHGTQVVIGHSLGSIVAYEALCKHPEWQIDTFVTLGSPLGIRRLVFDALAPRPEGAQGAWPHVRRWVNIADVGDIVALEKRLATCFGPVEDQAVYNGWKSHSVLHYLTARETGLAVARGLSS
jgi:hypothetical protein